MVNSFTLKAVTVKETRNALVDLASEAFKVWDENDSRDELDEVYKEGLDSLANFIEVQLMSGASIPVPGLILGFKTDERIEIADGAMRYKASQIVSKRHPDKQILAQLKLVENPYLVKDEGDRDKAIGTLIALGLNSETIPKGTIGTARILQKLLKLDDKTGKQKRIATLTGIKEQQVSTYAKLFKLNSGYCDLFYSKFMALNTVIFAAENGATPEDLIAFHNQEGDKPGNRGFKLELSDVKLVLAKSQALALQADTEEEQCEYEQYESTPPIYLDPEALSVIDNEKSSEELEQIFEGTEEKLKELAATTTSTADRRPLKPKAEKVAATSFTRENAALMANDARKNKANVTASLIAISEADPDIDESEGKVTITISLADWNNLVQRLSSVIKL